MKSTISQEQISNTAVRLGIPDVPFTHRRIARAFDLFETNKVNEVSREDGIYRVHSQYNDAIYTVEVNHGRPHCTCPDGKKTVFCKHMIASMMTAFEQEQEPKLTRNFDYDRRIAVKETPNPKVKASWVVIENGQTYVNVWQDLNGKICCVCGAYYKKDCIHKQAIRDFYDGGNGSKRIENYCGSVEAKAIQDKLNGNNGTGDTKSPSHQLDTSDPFQESEQRDIDQIEGRSNGDLVHVLSNGKYIISYHGIMALAEQHNVTFEASTHDETRTVIAQGRCGNNSRASGKPINGSEMTAVELAKRNAARQLLPLPEIKALEHKVKLEVEFDWQVAKRKCLEIVPDFTLDILITDMVRDGKLEQKHSSDYSRKEWLLIFDACKKDAETRVRSHALGNDNNDGGDNTPSSDIFAECRDAAKNFVRYSWLKDAMLKSGEVSGDWTGACDRTRDDIAKLKEVCEIDASLFGKELGHWTIEIQPNQGKWAYQRRYQFWLTPMSKRCFWCAETEGVMPDTFIEWGRYTIKTSLCLECSEKVGNGELDKDAIVQKFDDLYHADPSEVPDNVDEFVERCKEAEADVVDDTTVDDDTPTNGDGKRKLQIDKKRNIVLIEPDGTKKPMTFQEVSRTFGGNVIMRLTQGIQLCGADISTVELDD